MVDHRLIGERLHRIDDRIVANLDHDDAGHHRKAAVRRTAEKERLTRIVAGVGTTTVAAANAGITTQDVGVGVTLLEVRPRDRRRGEHRQHGSGELAHDRLTDRLLPPALGLAVVHHQIAVAQPAGGAEIEHLIAHSPIEGDRGVAERTVRDRHGEAADLVVDDLVPDQDLPRITADRAVVLEHDDGLAILHPAVGLAHGDEAGMVNGGNTVLRRSTRNYLVQGDRVLREISLPPPGAERHSYLLSAIVTANLRFRLAAR